MGSALLLSLKPLSFTPFCHCKSASPSSFLPSRSLCVPDNIKLFKHDTLSLFSPREQPRGLPSVFSTPPKGRREGGTLCSLWSILGYHHLPAEQEL